jgi:hypothetical protein
LLEPVFTRPERLIRGVLRYFAFAAIVPEAIIRELNKSPSHRLPEVRMARNGRQRQNTVVVDAIAIAMIREKDPRKILRREAGRGVLGESISQL